MASKVDDIKRRKSLTAEQRQAKAAKTVASLKRDGLTTSLKVNDDDPDGSAAVLLLTLFYQSLLWSWDRETCRLTRERFTKTARKWNRSR